MPEVPRSCALDEWIVSPDGRFRACFTDIGEGMCGDYDPDDPEDEPLLRFDVQINEADSPLAEDPASAGTDDPADPDFGWYWVRDGSYCTQVNAEKVTGEQMYDLLQRILGEIDGERSSVKRQLEQASWMRIDDLEVAQ
jgi:hypothetical protein